MPPRWHSGLFVGALVVSLVVFLSRGRARVAPSASTASPAQWRPDVVAASGSNVTNAAATREGRAGAGVVAATSESVAPPPSAAAPPAVRERRELRDLSEREWHSVVSAMWALKARPVRRAAVSGVTYILRRH